MSKGLVLCALYPDPVTGYPPKYARETIPTITHYPDGTPVPNPKDIGFKPGELIGCVSGELGLREYIESQGYEFIVTSDKEGPNSEVDKYLPEAEIVISQPFWPIYLTEERINKAKKLKLALTAGIGSDHYNIPECIKHGITVAEETYSNSVSVAEHAVMQMLILVRNFVPSQGFVLSGGWNIADCVSRSYDIEGMEVGVIAAGRIGRAVLERMHSFGCKLHYYDLHRLPEEYEKKYNITYHDDPKKLAQAVDIVSIHCPLYDGTRHMFNRELINSMRRGSYIINTARAEIVVRDDIVSALEDGQLAGYAGDVWFPQPAPADHPWRSMPHQGMTPHISGTSLSAQYRYGAGTREILECWFEKRPINDLYLIADPQGLAGTGAKSYGGDKK